MNASHENEEVSASQQLAYLQRRLAEAEAEARARDEFLAHLAHDLRTPLGPIANLIAVLNRRQDLPADIGPILEMMERNLWREVRLVEQLVDAMQVLRGTLRLDRLLVDLDALLRETLDMLADQFKTAGVELAPSLGAAGILADADPDRLRQLFRILLDHARVATPAGGHVTVRSADVGDRGLWIVIEDGGTALSPEQLSRLFRPFDRPGGEPNGGLRLDMPIAKGIVEAHGGTLEAVSRGEGRGTHFDILLPKAGT